MVLQIEKHPWVESQSGRKKQDFGPQANFKKRKLKTSKFKGLPLFAKTHIQRLLSFKDDSAFAQVVQGFEPIEVNILEYQ